MRNISISDNSPATLALARQKDLYAMLSQTNRAIVRMASRDELFLAVCRIAVEHGHFLFAWIGLIDRSDSRVKPVTKYGADGGYVEQVRILADPSDTAGRGPTGEALRSGMHVITNDFINDLAAAPWHEVARRAGVCAKSAFALRLQGVVIGTLNLYAGEPGYFTEDLLPTLDSMAENVSFALDNFARETERTQALEALRESEERLSAIFEGARDGILVADPETGKFVIGNPTICRQLGYTLEELLRLSVSDIHRQQDLPHAMEDFESQRQGTRKLAEDMPMLRKDGSVYFADIQAGSIRFGGKNCMLGIFRDVTERRSYVAELKRAFISTVGVATTLSEMRDPYTAGHERRVAQIAVAIGAELGFDAHRQEGLRVAGQLHDVGKITIPAEILVKPGKITQVELELIKAHSRAGYDVLKDVEFPWPVAEVALQHHERMDGSGYPQGLKGEAIE